MTNSLRPPTEWDYHPDPVIDAQVRADALAADMADLAAGYLARWWVCPNCGRFHQRGYFLGFGQHRCLNCGYVGDRGTMHTNRPRTPNNHPNTISGKRAKSLLPLLGSNQDSPDPEAGQQGDRVG